MTQAQADHCCAASERNQSATTRASFVAAGTIVPAPASIPLVVIPKPPALQQWRALIPLPVSPVPKHLLLSVLLV